jgi:hypothetical protein
MSLPVRLAIVLTPLLVWGVLYLLSRLGGISPPRFIPWLKAGFFVLVGAWFVLVVLDRTRWSEIVMIHAFGLFGASSWIMHRYKREQTKTLLTSLEL